MREGWKLADVTADRKELVVGHEEWPFPVPLVKTAQGWAFDGTAGKEEVLTRRIGRNELAVLRIAATYVTAQRVYARRGARRRHRLARMRESSRARRAGRMVSTGR